MKRKFLLSIAMISSLIISAKDKVVQNPVFSDGSFQFCPKTIVLGSVATTVGFKVSSGAWALASTAHLMAEGKVYRMTKATVFTRSADKTVTGSEPLDPAKRYSRENDSISIEFEPIDAKVKVIDFVEEEGSNFNSSGIRLDGKCYPFALGKPKPYPYAKNEPLQPLELTYGKAKYTCNVFKYEGTKKDPTMFGLNNCFSNDQYLNFGEDSYEIEASRSYTAGIAAPYPYHQFGVFMVPGFETEILVDETAATAAHLGKKIPTDKIIQFAGPIADLQQVRYDGTYLQYDMASDSPDALWEKLQGKLQDIEKNKTYNRRQKDFGRLRAEFIYVYLYNKMVSQNKASQKDVHAPELEIFHDGRSFYLINNDDYLTYAHANGISGVVTEWMEGYRRAKNMAKRIRGLELMPETAFDTIPQLFQYELRRMNDSTRVAIEKLRKSAKEVKVMDTPNCTGQEFLGNVVRENPGVVLFFDFWATWCGPCMAGIKAMEPLKEEWADKPIRFVYVTNESSPANQWTQQIASMPGLHYRLPDTIWNAIPNLEGIPQYYIYDPQGNRFFEQTGFDGIEPLKQKIEEALKQ